MEPGSVSTLGRASVESVLTQVWATRLKDGGLVQLWSGSTSVSLEHGLPVGKASF